MRFMSATQLSEKDEIRAFIARRVAEGFDSEEEIVEEAIGYFSEELGESDELNSLVEELACELLEAHQESEQSWQGDTDCDRLDRAFSELEENGIVARQNFTCCQTCGHAEIWEEIEQAKQEERETKPSGYVFYHMQDTERAVEDGALYLAYGAVDNSDDMAIKTAQKISEILRRNGLDVSWNGSLDKRLLVENMTWRRRRCS